MPTAEPARRRTQAQRTAHTRAALIEATIVTIRDHGYRATTNRSVAERAGVSLGAMSHHFTSRHDLIATTLDDVGQRVATSLGARAATVTTTDSARTGHALDLLWELFSGDLFVVWLKVWLAASEDPQLYAALAPIEQRLSNAIATAVVQLTPPQLDPKLWRRRIGVAIDTMRGLALTERFEPHHSERRRDRWPTARAELLRLLEG